MSNLPELTPAQEAFKREMPPMPAFDMQRSPTLMRLLASETPAERQERVERMVQVLGSKPAALDVKSGFRTAEQQEAAADSPPVRTIHSMARPR